MPGHSKSSYSLMFRVKMKEYEQLKQRAESRGLKVSEYLKERIDRDILRSRHKKKW